MQELYATLTRVKLKPEDVDTRDCAKKSSVICRRMNSPVAVDLTTMARRSWLLQEC